MPAYYNGQELGAVYHAGQEMGVAYYSGQEVYASSSFTHEFLIEIRQVSQDGNDIYGYNNAFGGGLNGSSTPSTIVSLNGTLTVDVARLGRTGGGDSMLQFGVIYGPSDATNRLPHGDVLLVELEQAPGNFSIVYDRATRSNGLFSDNLARLATSTTSQNSHHGFEVFKSSDLAVDNFWKPYVGQQKRFRITWDRVPPQ